MSPRDGLDVSDKRNFLALPGVESRISTCSDPSLITVPTELSLLLPLKVNEDIMVKEICV